MFKKTLLALSVATIASTATAGTLVSSVTETSVPVAAYVDAGALSSDCGALATTYSATIDLNGFVPTGAGADTVTGGVLINGGTAGTFDTAANVLQYVGIAECNITINKDISSTTPVSSSIEAAQNTTVAANASLISGIGGYTAGDTITINISGASIDTVTSTAPTLAGGGLTIGVLDITTSAVRFSVTAGTSPGNAIFALTGVNLDATGLGADTEVSYSAFATNTSGTDFDTSSGLVVADLVPQYSSSVTAALDGVIDVSADRKSLAVNADDTTAGQIVNQDTLTVAVSLDATGDIITPATVSYVISGDFTWLDASADGTDDATAATPTELATYLTAGFYTGTGDDTFLSATLNEDLDELTVVTTAAGGDVDTVANFLFPVQGAGATNEVLNESDYSVSVVASDATASPNTITMSAGSNAAGAWTLNGSVVTIPYMPFDANTAVILRHTNTGVQTGDVTVRYMLEGVSTAWTSAGVVASSSRGVMNLRNAVMDAIMADAGVTSGKVAIEITTNVPAADVTVYAAYKVRDEQDRGFVGTFGEHGSAN